MSSQGTKRLAVLLRCQVKSWVFRFDMEVPLMVDAQRDLLLRAASGSGLHDIHTRVMQFWPGTDGVTDVKLETASFANSQDCLSWLQAHPDISNIHQLQN